MSNEPDPNEQRLALDLERAHEALLDGRGITDVVDAQPSGPLDSGIEVLRLIEEVRNAEATAARQLDGPPARLRQIPIEEIGRYETVRLLGEGSHGLVYLANDLQLERQVALKVPRIEVLISPDLRYRFLREAKAAAALSHPNIVPVFEAGLEGKICFIAYEFCDGESLAAWIDRWRLAQAGLPYERIAELIATLADAVQYAHSRGVVHRDLKPSNVLVPDTTDDLSSDHTRRILISDFGLAKMADVDDGQTCTGAILGTPAYMSPEQASGGVHGVGIASDVYSLGAIFYELLTLRRPFDEASTLATLEAVRSREPQAPRRIRGGIPADLEAICLKCLEKKPQNRYLSSAELRADCERFLRNEPVLAKPITNWGYMRRWVAKYPVLSAVSATLVLTLLISSVVLAGLSLELGREAQRARLAELQANTLLEELSQKLQSKSQADLIRAWTSVLDSGSRTANNYFERGNCYWQSEQFELAIADFEEAVQVDPDHLWANDYLAWVLVAGPESLRDPGRAKGCLDRIKEKIPLSWATLVTAGVVEYRLSHFQQAIDLMNLSVRAKGNNGTFATQIVLAMAHHRLGAREHALSHFQLAEKLLAAGIANSSKENSLLLSEAQNTLGLAQAGETP